MRARLIPLDQDGNVSSGTREMLLSRLRQQPLAQADPSKRAIVIELIGALPLVAVVLPIQVLGELFNILVHKAGHGLMPERPAVLA